MGPKNPRSRLFTLQDEAIILAYRWRTRHSLDDCLHRLRRLMPKLSRSALHRCLRRRGFSKIGSTATSPHFTSASLTGPYTFEITAIEIVFRQDGFGVVVPVFLALEEVTKEIYAEALEATAENAAAFLVRLVAEFSQKITTVTTDILPIFTDWRAHFNEDMAEVSPHPFSVACRANRIVHTRTIPPHQMPIALKNHSKIVEIRYYQPPKGPPPARGW